MIGSIPILRTNMIGNAKRLEHRASQVRPTGFEFPADHQYDASVAGRTPRLSSAGTTGSSPVGISIPS